MNNIQNTSISFNGKNISSYAWWISVLSFLDQIWIWELCQLRISEARGNRNIGRPSEYTIWDTIYSLIRWFSLWARHITDISHLTHDPIVELSNRRIPSQWTFSKKINLFDWATATQLVNIHNRICDQYFTHATTGSKLACLNISDDSSSIQTFGKQEWAEYIHHYRVNWFHPDFTTEDQTRLILMWEFRDWNVYSSKWSELLIKETLERYWKYTDVVKFRADSAYGKWAILDELHNYIAQWNKLEAYVKAKTYKGRLINNNDLVEYDGKSYLMLDLPKEYFEEETSEWGKKFVDKFFSISHKATSWKRAEKIVVRIRRNEDERGESLLNMVHKDIEFLIVIWEKEGQEAFDEYAKRGKQEQIMEEVKNDAFLKKLSHQSRVVNECVFQIKIIVHNLMQILRLVTLYWTKYANCKTRTVRKIMVNVWWKIVYHARKIYIRLSKVFLYKDWYNTVLERLRNLNLWLA